MKKSESIGALAKALCAAQSQIRGAVKDATNPFFKSDYADLESVCEAIKEPFAKNGLSVTQVTSKNSEAGVFVLETILMHESGEWISGEYPIYSKDNSPQAMGSALTYARRYALSAIAGVHQTDDDGNDAQKKPKQPDKKSEPPRQPTPTGAKSADAPKPIVDPEWAAVGKEIRAAMAEMGWKAVELEHYIKSVYKKDMKLLTVEELKQILHYILNGPDQGFVNDGRE